MSNKTEQYLQIVRDYKKQHGVTTVIAREVAAWAIQNGLWEPEKTILIKECAEDLSRAMREDYIIDLQGRKIRSQHVFMKEINGELFPMWVFVKTATRDQMVAAFGIRRRQIVADCRQLKLDVDGYNENYNDGLAIQLNLDFRKDMEEALTVIA